MEDLTKEEKKKLWLQKQKEEAEKKRVASEQHKTEIEKEIAMKKSRKKRNRILVVSILISIILLSTAFGIYYSKKPGKYDEFAKCLTEKGAVIYGVDTCQYTQGQKAMFGKSFKYIDYKHFSQGPNIQVTPTWMINGNRYEKVQSFERLSAITGCKI